MKKNQQPVDESTVTVRCMVACTNAAGDPELAYTTVTLPQYRYDLGDHYDLAKEQLLELGYESPVWVVDEHESAFVEPPVGWTVVLNVVDPDIDNTAGFMTHSSEEVMEDAIREAIQEFREADGWRGELRTGSSVVVVDTFRGEVSSVYGDAIWVLAEDGANPK